MKVKVSDFKGDKQEIEQLERHIAAKVKNYITERPNKFRTLQNMCTLLRIPPKSFEFKVVCMNCGDITPMSSYAIAQIASGNKLTYECKCEHITTLPQII